jgi:hypothetical protein
MTIDDLILILAMLTAEFRNAEVNAEENDEG